MGARGSPALRTLRLRVRARRLRLPAGGLAPRSMALFDAVLPGTRGGARSLRASVRAPPQLASACAASASAPSGGVRPCRGLATSVPRVADSPQTNRPTWAAAPAPAGSSRPRAPPPRAASAASRSRASSAAQAAARRSSGSSVGTPRTAPRRSSRSSVGTPRTPPGSSWRTSSRPTGTCPGG
jgi:hypothetical protein